MEDCFIRPLESKHADVILKGDENHLCAVYVMYFATSCTIDKSTVQETK